MQFGGICGTCKFVSRQRLFENFIPFEISTDAQIVPIGFTNLLSLTELLNFFDEPRELFSALREIERLPEIRRRHGDLAELDAQPCRVARQLDELPLILFKIDLGILGVLIGHLPHFGGVLTEQILNLFVRLDLCPCRPFDRLLDVIIVDPFQVIHERRDRHRRLQTALQFSRHLIDLCGDISEPSLNTDEIRRLEQFLFQAFDRLIFLLDQFERQRLHFLFRISLFFDSLQLFLLSVLRRFRRLDQRRLFGFSRPNSSFFFGGSGFFGGGLSDFSRLFALNGDVRHHFLQRLTDFAESRRQLTEIHAGNFFQRPVQCLCIFDCISRLEHQLSF